MPQISVIVPVYNADAFLAQCLDSILAQTERDFELLLIDDGSTDGSPAICDAYAAQEPRIRVIHKPNGGVSSARNAGLDRAHGSFIVFIDSDDYVDPDYLEGLCAAMNEAEYPEKTLILTDYQPFSPTGNEPRDFPLPFTVDLSTPPADPQAFRDLIFGFRLFPPYCKLFRRDVIEAAQLRFDTTIRSAEDFDFNLRYLSHMNVIRYLPAATYHYRVDYKKYRPSNRGVLGDSEIKSAHIMLNEMTKLARRMGIFETLQPEIEHWAAQKHYINRLEMLFAPSEKVGKSERKALYRQLLSDPVYRNAAKRGAATLPKSTRRLLACRADFFEAWFLYYSLQRKRSK